MTFIQTYNIYKLILEGLNKKTKSGFISDLNNKLPNSYNLNDKIKFNITYHSLDKSKKHGLKLIKYTEEEVWKKLDAAVYKILSRPNLYKLLISNTKFSVITKDKQCLFVIAGEQNKETDEIIFVVISSYHLTNTQYYEHSHNQTSIDSKGSKSYNIMIDEESDNY